MNIVMCTATVPGGAVTRVRVVAWGYEFRSVRMSGEGMRVVTGDEKERCMLRRGVGTDRCGKVGERRKII